MLLNRQSAVVESALQELLLRNKENAENAQSGKVLALLFSHMNGMDLGMESLKMLREAGIHIRICPDTTLLELWSINEIAGKTGIDDWISLEKAEIEKEQIDHIFIPVLPFSIVSDLMNFNDSRPPVRMLLWALMRGKHVSALSPGADPYHSIWQESGLNHGTTFLKHEMQKQLQQIRGCGIHLMKNLNEMWKYVASGNRGETNQVITADMMDKLAKDGKQFIDATKGTIITPLARDIAKKHQIRIGDTRGG